MKTSKQIQPHTLAAAFTVLVALLVQFGASFAHAQTTYYWDNDGTTSGFGNAGGTWTAPTISQWSTSSAGTATPGASVTTTTNDPLHFGTDSVALGSGTITVSGTVNAASLRFGSQTTGNVTLSGGTINLAPATTIHVGAGSPTLHTISSTITGAGTSLTKAGSGTLTFSGLSGTAADNYSGTTIIGDGTLAITTTSPAITGGLTFGASPASPTVGALDLSAASAKFGNLTVQTTNAAATNVITIGSGRALTNTASAVANVVTVGGATAGSAKLQVAGASAGDGTFTVNDPTRNIVVATTSTTAANNQTLNLSGLGTFNATIADLAVGRPTSAAGAAAAGWLSDDSLILAGTNTITASGVIVVGGTATSPNGTQKASMTLGTVNTLNVPLLVVGCSRSSGTVQFNTGLTAPTVTLRGASGGTSRTSIYLGDQANLQSAANAGGGSSTSLGTMDLSVGTLDARIGSLYVGYGATGVAGGTFGAGNGVFTFGGASSVVDINTLVIGQDQNNGSTSTTTSKTTSTGTFTMNDGSLTVNTAMTLASDSDAVSGGTVQSVVGTFNLAGGSATITPGIVLGNHSSTGTGTATARLNLTGGTLSVGGNIREGTTGSGVINSSITNNGATLNLNGKNITSVNTITYISGLITNLGVVNTGMTLAGTGSREFGQASGTNGTIQGVISGAGVGLTKTGDGTLTLSGANTYDGPTTVSGGKLVMSSTAISATGAATVAANATLGVTASGTSQWPPVSLTLADPCTLEFNSVQNPGTTTAPLSPTTGPGTVSGVTVNINSIVGTVLINNRYPLAGQVSATNGYTLGAQPIGVTGHLDIDSSTLVYVVDSAADVWTGADGTNPTWWDIATTANWDGKALINSPPGSYANGDGVLFDDSAIPASPVIVDIQTPVAPANLIFVNSTKDYIITNGGANIIGGTGSLLKSGSGKVTFAGGAHTYSGATTISAGTLELGDGTSGNDATIAGTGGVTNNGTLIYNRFGSSTASYAINGSGAVTKLGAGTQTLSGASTYSGTTSVNGGQLNINNRATDTMGILNVAGLLAGDLATVNIGGGTLNFGAGRINLGGQGGGVGDGTINQTGGTITFAGGDMIVMAGGAPAAGLNATYNLSGGTIDASAGGKADRGLLIAANLRGNGTFNLSGTGILLLGTNIMEVTRAESAVNGTSMSGTFNQTGGTAQMGFLSIGGSTIAKSTNSQAYVNLTGGTFVATNFVRLAGGYGDTNAILIGGTADVTLPAFPLARGTGSTNTLTLDGGTLRPLAASASYLQAGTFDQACLTTNGANFNVASGNDITVAQVLQNAPSQAGKLTKSGAGILSLTGTNTYTGNTIVSAGTLAIQVASIATNSTVSVAQGAQLSLDFAGTNIVTSFVTNGVPLAAGVYNAANVGPFLAGTGSLQVPGGGSVPPTPATLTKSYSGGVLTLTWPAGQNWRLVGQTNSRSIGLNPSTNAWFTVPGGVDGSNSITIDPNQPTVLFRLVWP